MRAADITARNATGCLSKRRRDCRVHRRHDREGRAKWPDYQLVRPCSWRLFSVAWIHERPADPDPRHGPVRHGPRLVQ